MRAAVLYIALTLYLAFPLSVHPGSRVMSASPDANLFMWTLAWDAHAFVSQPLRIFDANIYYPEPRTLAYSENLIGSAFFAAPILWMTGNMVLAMNLVALLSCVLCASGAYLLARRIGVSATGALIAGVVFGFSPPRFFRLEQLHLGTIQWVPFALASAHAYLSHGRRRDLHWTLGLFTLQALTSGHGAVFLLLSLLGLTIYAVARGEPIAAGRRLRDAGIAGVLLLLPTALMLIPYLLVQREMGLRRTLENWASSWASFGASPSYVHGWILERFESTVNARADAYLFPGYLPVLLAVVAVLGVIVRRRPASDARLRPDKPGTAVEAAWATIFYALVTLVAVWLSLGPPLGLWPLVYWLPGLNFIRVPSRFMLLAILGLAVLAGLGFDRLAAATGRPRRAVLAAAIVLLMAAEFASPLETEEYRVDIPPVDRWLATQPAPMVVAELPLASPRSLGAWERRHTTFMLHSTAHWQKTIEGYSGIRPPWHAELYETLASFPERRSIDALVAAGVTRLVVHADYYGQEEWQAVEARLATYGDHLALVHTEGEGRVYAIRP
ncbi:MAG: hypothetical protein IT176_12250 [Acidobacteria bacterium]|nr:hypothetical protein [Acidobacteriota bacterium]